MILQSRLATLAILSGCFLLEGCNSVKKTLGIDRDPPDEFSVIPSNPVLEMPPEFFVLPTPQPGVARPQEVREMDARKAKLLGSSAVGKGAASPAQEALLEMAGAEKEKHDIRKEIDEESHIERVKGKPWLEQLGLQKSKTKDVIDPYKETVELQKQGIPQNKIVAPE